MKRRVEQEEDEQDKELSEKEDQEDGEMGGAIDVGKDIKKESMCFLCG